MKHSNNVRAVRRSLTRAGILVSALLAFSIPWAAQTAPGVISATVVDQSGAVVAGATVEIKRLPDGPIWTAVTNAEGSYSSPPLQPGQYRIIVQSTGFRRYEQTVTLGSHELRLTCTLQVGEVAETVEVTAATPQLQAQTSSTQSSRIGRRLKSPPPPALALQAPYPRRQTNAEQYAAAEEEGFQSVTRRPLSTFAADVDTASYSNVRRFLRDGRLPPPDAVRIEEMLNYFHYSDRVPEAGEPFAVTTEIGRAPWNAEHKLLRVAVRTRPLATAELPPSNLVFLIDVSGSMQPENKLPLVKRAMRMLAGQLRHRDRVAIVVYAGAAGLVLPATPGSRQDRILDAIEHLEAGGSTAGAQGLELAYRVAAENFMKRGNNRVILATDGDFNVGPNSDEDMVRLIERERRRGVFLTVAGVGYGNLKDSKLEKLADHGNGNYAYLDSIAEARKSFVREFGATMVTAAKDVKLQVEFNPVHVSAWRLIGYDNRRLNDADFANDAKDAGDLGAGHAITALYELAPPSASDAGSYGVKLKYQEPPAAQTGHAEEVATVKIRYKEPTASSSRELQFAVAHGLQDAPSPDFRFAAGVAQFGMVLRDSAHRGSASLDSAVQLVEDAIGEDADGLRAEFVYLAKLARDLQRATARR